MMILTSDAKAKLHGFEANPADPAERITAAVDLTRFRE
jgi:hypothetical protein